MKEVDKSLVKEILKSQNIGKKNTADESTVKIQTVQYTGNAASIAVTHDPKEATKVSKKGSKKVETTKTVGNIKIVPAGSPTPKREITAKDLFRKREAQAAMSTTQPATKPAAKAPAKTSAPAAKPTAKAPAKTSAPAAKPVAKTPAKTTAPAAKPVAKAPAKTSAPAAKPVAKAPAKTPAPAAKPVAKTPAKTTAPAAKPVAKAPAKTSAPAAKSTTKEPVKKNTDVTGDTIVHTSPNTRSGKFEVKKSKDGRFVFNLYASNNVIVATSQTYSSSSAAMTGIQSVIANAKSAPIEDQTVKNYTTLPYPKWEIYADKGNQFRFRLNASNGSCICHSQGYTSKANCKKGIESIIRFASDADVSKSYLEKKN